MHDPTTYCYLKKDLTKSIERTLNTFAFDLFQDKRITQSQYYYLRSTDANAPRIYGLLKVHKTGMPLRPIVSFIDSPLYNLSKFIKVLYHHWLVVLISLCQILMSLWIGFPKIL